MKRKWNAAACLLLALGLLLTGCGLFFGRGPEGLLEYVLIAPKEEGAIERLVEKKDEALESMAETLRCSTVSAQMNGAYIAAEDAGTSAQAALLAGSEGFFEVYPRYLVSGRLLSETELRTGEAKAVLDEDLAFKLFPTVDPIGQVISADGIEMEVVGVVRHARRVGETELHSIYAPLLAVQELPFETVMLSAIELPNSGANIMFGTVASDSWQGGGYDYRMEKEVLRARLPVLYSAVVFAFACVVWLIRRVNGLTVAFAANIRERLRREYIGRILPKAVPAGLGLLALYAALGCAAWFTGLRAVEPLYIFPEWVPENLVQWAAIRDVFWNLAVDGVRLIDVASAQVRAVQFWGGVINWGVLFLLMSAILLLCGRRKNA